MTATWAPPDRVAKHTRARQLLSRRRAAEAARVAGLGLADREAERLAAESARLDRLDRLAVRCPYCDEWTLANAPTEVRRGQYRPRVNGAAVKAHRCPVLRAPYPA